MLTACLRQQLAIYTKSGNLVLFAQEAQFSDHTPASLQKTEHIHNVLDEKGDATPSCLADIYL